MKRKPCQVAFKIARRLQNGSYPVLDDLAAYVDAHITAGMNCYDHGGSLLDLDCMVALENILGYPVTWELYEYIDSRYPGDLNAADDDPDQGRADIAPIVNEYINERNLE